MTLVLHGVWLSCRILLKHVEPTMTQTAIWVSVSGIRLEVGRPREFIRESSNGRT